MHALFVNFSVPGKTAEEVIELVEPQVPAFADIPGNLAKIWLADVEAGRYGALYLWRDPESMQAFLASELWRAVKSNPAFADFDVRPFTVIEAFTKATQPALTIV
jgi:heme-degrading monooxygenase HmoA